MVQVGVTAAAALLPTRSALKNDAASLLIGASAGTTMPVTDVNTSPIATRLRELVRRHNREFVWGAIVQALLGIAFSFLTFGFVFSVGFWAKPLVNNATLRLKKPKISAAA